MAGLTPEQIQALLGKGDTRGVYVSKLNQFMDSPEQGVNVTEQWPELATDKAGKAKLPSTLKQGFENAKGQKKARPGADTLVKVILDGDLVYLIKDPNAVISSDGDSAEAAAPQPETVQA